MSRDRFVLASIHLNITASTAITDDQAKIILAQLYERLKIENLAMILEQMFPDIHDAEDADLKVEEWGKMGHTEIASVDLETS